MIKKQLPLIFLLILLLFFAVAVSARTAVAESSGEFSSAVSEVVKNNAPDEVFRDAYIDTYAYENGEPLATPENLSSALGVSLSTGNLAAASDERLIVRENRAYYTDASGVRIISGVIIKDGVTLLPINKTAAALGYDVTQTDGGAVITRPFQSARLIADAEYLNDTCGATDVITNGQGVYILQYATEAEAISAYDVLAADESVNYVEPDVYMYSYEYKSWGYGTNYTSMSDYSTWLVSAFDNLPQVVVAVIDSGINYDHELFSGRIITDLGRDFVNNDDDATDDYGHGTHVAGIVVDGTLTNVKILPLKVLDFFGSGSTSNIANAINYAVQQKADVINLSLGGVINNVYEASLIKNAINAAVAEDIVVCVAAGNKNIDVSSVTPANVEAAITVANVTADKVKASDSNFGKLVDIAATGENISSSNYYSNNTYINKSGTSMAAPHVSAAAAMLKSFYKGWSSEDIEAILDAHVLKLNASNIGSGLLCMNGIKTDDRLKLILHDTAVTLYPGQTYALNFTIAGSASSLTFSSDNSEVATVENGVLTGIGEGSCTVTVAADGISRTCTVDVKNIEMSLDAYAVSIYTGESYTPAATVIPELELTFTVTPSDILSLDGATATALKPGEATLTVTAAKGLAGEVSKTVSVTVKDYGEWYDGALNNYTVSSGGELYEMSLLLKHGIDNFNGKTVTLGNDISLSGYENKISLGSEDFPFEGVFDGAGHTVTSFALTSGEVSGLFGDVNNAVIKNLTVTATEVKGSDLAAVLCANAENSVIVNCSVSGNVIADAGIAGGICGSSHGTDIVNCLSTASVGGGLYSGGVCGFIVNAQADVSPSYIVDPSLVIRVINCVNTGVVENAVAGYIGCAVVENCLYRDASGATAYELSEGASRIDTASFNASGTLLDGMEVNKANASLNAYVIGNSKFADISLCVWTTADSQPVLSQGSYTLNETVLSFNGDLAATVGVGKAVDVTCNGVNTITYSLADDTVASVSGNGVVTGLVPGETTLTASDGSNTAACKITVYPSVGWYNGTGDYSLSDADDIAELAALVNNGVDDFFGAKISLAGDIDMSAVAEHTFIGDYSCDIGFRGDFDGAGYTVSGVKITANGYLTGFFGRLGDGGKVQNLHLSDITITAGAEENAGVVGAVAALVSHGASIQNCSVGGTVTTSAGTAAAGIAGYNFGIIENCVNYTRVSADAVNSSSVAGIAAVNYGSVAGCVNLGAITSEKGSVGGIICHNRTTDFYGIEASVANSYGTSDGAVEVTDITRIKAAVAVGSYFDVNFDGEYDERDVLLIIGHMLRT